MDKEKDCFCEYQHRIIDFNKERNWGDAHNPKNLAMSIAIEAAELMEIFQWVSIAESKKIVDEKVLEHIGEEIADVMIYSMSIANQFDMSITEIIEDKMKKNAEKYPAR